MIVKHYYVEKIAHSSYIMAGDTTCAVVDPSRDVTIYVEEARKLGLKITHILETHLHADFVSGHMELAERTGAKIVMPTAAKAEFDHEGVKEGDVFFIEDMKISVLETPGHTPEHVSFVVTDTATGDEPISVFVGDTLFVGDAGRPDLFPNRADELARKLYDSLFNKLLKLPDFCEVYPAHGAGSLCGKSMGAKYTSTIGYERKFNPVLQNKEVDVFVKALTEDMPGAPDHFSRSSKINAVGPKPIDQLPEMAILSPPDFKKMSEKEDTIIVDVRSYHAFGGLHIPMSYSLDASGNLPTFAGWVLPPEKKILMVAESYEQAKEAVLWMQRVGMDQTVGYLDGGLHNWAAMGYPVDKVPQMSPEEFKSMKDSDDLILIDGRDKLAYEEDHIEGAINIPSPDLRTRYEELDLGKDVLIVCNSGVRSNLGISILKQKGFKQVMNLAGGMQGYLAYKK
jgi:glyoxylase-like metal-dependent hydrolase (beta-lactamase superfamily II)/rhodanese-related sulfurtransferase